MKPMPRAYCMTRGLGLRDHWSMNGFAAYVLASGILVGCIFLPALIAYQVLEESGVSFCRLAADRERRNRALEALTRVILLEVTFTGFGTIMGIIPAAFWWLLTAKFRHGDPITFALQGGGVGFIATVILSVPLLAPRAVTRTHYSDEEQAKTAQERWWRQGFHGPPRSRGRFWARVIGYYVAFLCTYAFVILVFSLMFYFLAPRSPRHW